MLAILSKEYKVFILILLACKMLPSSCKQKKLLTRHHCMNFMEITSIWWIVLINTGTRSRKLMQITLGNQRCCLVYLDLWYLIVGAIAMEMQKNMKDGKY